ncbi:MAG: helix-turn-helix domain-containing protein [Acidobacteriota bacterium]
MKKTNFDRYLDEQMKDSEFAARYEGAGEAWDVAMQLTALRQEAGLSQKELARRLKTSQQHISRLESPGYEGHSLANLRKVAGVLRARVRVTFEPKAASTKKRTKRASSSVRAARRKIKTERSR